MNRFFKPIVIFQAIVVIYILLPMIIIILVSFTDQNYISLPSQRLSFEWYLEILRRPELSRALVISLSIAIIAAVISTVLGTTGAFLLSRYRFLGQGVMDAVFMSPLMVPAVVTGIAILQFFSSIGVQSYFMLIIGHVVITIPYSIRTVSACLANFNKNLELAAMNLGADWFYTLRTITFPLIKAGLFAGAIFAFVISFGDATVSVFLVWSNTVTLPVEIYNRLRLLSDPTVAAVSSLTVFGSVALIFLLEKTFGLRKIF